MSTVLEGSHRLERPGAEVSSTRAYIAEANTRFDDVMSLYTESHREAHWQSVMHVDPSQGEYLFRGHNKGQGVQSVGTIYNTNPRQYLRVLHRGILQGEMDQTRNWFRHETRHDWLNTHPAVRTWLEKSRDGMLRVFSQSNWYDRWGELFKHEGLVGTGAMFIFEDDVTRIRCETIPIGSYGIAQDARGAVDTFVQAKTMTLRQAAQEFGVEKLPLIYREAFTSNDEQSRKSQEQMIIVRYLLQPNPAYDPNGEFALNFKYREIYWYYSASEGARQPNYGADGGDMGDQYGVLKVGGYHEFPVIVARGYGKGLGASPWALSGPGLDSVEDNRQLQSMERKTDNALDKNIDPPLVGGPGLEGKAVSLLAGGVTIDPDMAIGGQTRLQPIYTNTFPVNEVEEKITKIENRIAQAYFVDIITMLLRDQHPQPKTAYEWSQRLQEKADMLGAIHVRHVADSIRPALERVFGILWRQSEVEWELGRDGVFPQPPEELEGEELIPVFESELASVQRAAQLGQVDRWIEALGLAAAQGIEGTLDAVDADGLADHYADALSIPEDLRVPLRERMMARLNRAQQLAAAQAAESAPNEARAMRDLSETDVGGGESALEAAMGAQQ